MTMATHEELLRKWQIAQARADMLIEFEKRGGVHRMRLSTEDEWNAEGNVLHTLMEGEGYRAMLATAIKKAIFDAGVARNAFLDNATAEAISAGAQDGAK